ncbi:helix-turn-helix transcriptional regulator [Pseudomonas sp. Snoq117.2]|uniref:AraC family transcriptional regulator n=1 Tax=Pseudomonas sp. Snoq117.2 TaxID=1500302 RepID=UPI0008BB0A99|nr:helix-turn-helix transcriptional regulator [Pseudomonas sp. Snoq117.2]SEP36319.1 AraC-type DNA-binding protein [Pseudomonas sp. Snoq117.2]
MTRLIDFSSCNGLHAVAQDYAHGERVPPHRHRQAQLIHALCGVVIVNTAQGRWVVPPGRGVWVPAGEEHDLHLLGRVEVRTLFVDPGVRAELPTRCQLIAVSPLLRELILAALPLPVDRPAEGRAWHILQLMLDELQGSPTAGLHLPWPVDATLADLCRHLRQYPGERWTLTRAATRLAVSERTLSRLFLKETGLSFGQWLQRARLDSSLTSLAAGHAIVDVALDHGYASPSAFATRFRQVLGVSPSAYRGQTELPVVPSPPPGPARLDR